MQLNATLTVVHATVRETKFTLEVGQVANAEWLLEHLGKDLVVQLEEAQPTLPLTFGEARQG